ncbi:ubiquitin-conjugating enzyme E2 J2 [Asbolus verrucosus]|uniref:Ubiquitin-conjugating enzyme E2 J2 n=1 Tax=Asbolus verrucosus TaxID=1661398 RepID=A0A482VIK9_ASBVE|nr:ubiquitin-conjugating enzyme E2 J2 [Asbolus verrucosus]
MSNRKPNSATSRLKQDYLRHYVVCGPENSPYEGGFYHGKLVFPREFPFKPPSIYMITPNGRFRTNKKLCLSISDFHPDTWNPAWSVSTILTGLLSFMLEKSPTLGSIETSEYDKRQFAYHSLEFNLKDKEFCDLFPDTVTKIQVFVLAVLLDVVEVLTQRSNVNNNAPDNQKPSRSVAEPSNFQSCITNLIVFIGVAAFAITVKYVVITTASETE